MKHTPVPLQQPPVPSFHRRRRSNHHQFRHQRPSMRRYHRRFASLQEHATRLRTLMTMFLINILPSLTPVYSLYYISASITHCTRVHGTRILVILLAKYTYKSAFASCIRFLFMNLSLVVLFHHYIIEFYMRNCASTV